MLAFACYHCGLKLQVNDDFAGQQAKCPTCKSILCVPAALRQGGVQAVPAVGARERGSCAKHK